VVGVAGEVLDRAPGEPGGCGQPHRLGHAGRLVGEAMFQVGGHRQVRRLDDPRRMLQGLVAGHPPVGPAKGRREPAAGRGQGMEARRRQQHRRPSVPGVGQQQRLLATVQGQEPPGLLELVGHGALQSGRLIRSGEACQSVPTPVTVVPREFSPEAGD
jgi:hypothetical protein